MKKIKKKLSKKKNPFPIKRAALFPQDKLNLVTKFINNEEIIKVWIFPYLDNKKRR